MAPILETGDEKAISSAKKEYRRKYKAEWRKKKRRVTKEITTAWNASEFKLLKDEAKRHNESVTRFIKRATVAYMDKRYVVPDEVKVTKVLQLLALAYNRISELVDETIISASAGRLALADLSQLEKDIRITLFSPKTIEQVLTEQVSKYPGDKNRLIEFIQTIA